MSTRRARASGIGGGYPVRLSRRGAEVVLADGLALEQAREFNLRGQEYDGLEEIRGNGDIIVMDEAYTTFKELLNIDCKVITIEESYEQAMELRKKFHDFVCKHGVDL